MAYITRSGASEKPGAVQTDVVGIFPDEASVRRLVGAILLEQNDEWQLQHRYMTLETMAGRPDEQPATLNSHRSLTPLRRPR